MPGIIVRDKLWQRSKSQSRDQSAHRAGIAAIGISYDFNTNRVSFLFKIVERLPTTLRTQFKYLAMANKAFPIYVCPPASLIFSSPLCSPYSRHTDSISAPWTTQEPPQPCFFGHPFLLPGMLFLVCVCQNPFYHLGLKLNGTFSERTSHS